MKKRKIISPQYTYYYHLKSLPNLFFKSHIGMSNIVHEPTDADTHFFQTPIDFVLKALCRFVLNTTFAMMPKGARQI
jgi:hypothetical protein